MNVCSICHERRPGTSPCFGKKETIFATTRAKRPNIAAASSGLLFKKSDSVPTEGTAKMFRGLLDFITNDNKVDEKMGMTEKQKKIVQNTWATVRKDPVSSGIAIMLALFTQHPEYQEQFKVFKDMPLDELPKNKKFQAHCANVVSAISSAIDQMHDPALMEANLLSLAERHKNRGQKLEHFQNLKQVMMNLLPTVFGKQYTPEAQEAWKKILDLMFSTLGQVYNN